MTANQTIDGVPRECRECGSTSLSWFAQNTVPNGIQQNRLNTHDVQCVFVLGCDACSETLKIISADKIAEHFNKPAAQPQVEPSHWADPAGNTITAELKAYNLKLGGAPSAAASRYTAALYAEQPAPVAVVPEPTYRLLGDGDIIREDDEVLNDDTATWSKQSPGVFLGMPYNRRVMLPVRRATSA